MKNLTAKNISKFRTDDGYAWSASFYLNGKKIGTAQNSGHGGPTNLCHIDDDALKEILAFANVTSPHNDYEFERAESVLEAVMWDVVDQRHTKSLLKRKVVARMPDGIFEWKIKKGIPTEKVIVIVKHLHPTAEILNEMPLDVANRILHPVSN